MKPRAEVLEYLEATCPGASCEALAGDASTRRFWRIRVPGAPSRVLMDYGYPFEGETDDVRLARLFRSAGLRVAEVLDVRGDAGCLLLEDLGDVTMEAAVADSAGPGARTLVERAVALVVRVATDGTAALALSPGRDGPALDTERFRFEMDFFVEHFVEGFLGCDSPRPDLRSALHDLADRAADTPRRVLCHRDFHSRNLMLPPDGSLAMVDIQDARWGPDSYDLVSLLRDAYIDIDDGWVDPMIETYLSGLDPRPEESDFRRRFHHVAVQRMIKALGTFGYQCGALRQERYRSAIPRTLARLNDLMPAREETRGLHDLFRDLLPF